jgi:hypothetical protein
VASPYRPPYADIQAILRRMYVDQVAPTNATRDTLLTELVSDLSRRFDRECGRQPGGFAPLYDVRVFSGMGRQVLQVDELVQITKVEISLSPGQSNPGWSDITAEIVTGQLAPRPLRVWPKDRLFRMQTFPVDPYQNGNVRITGIYGCVQPDLGATAPVLDGTQNPPIVNDGSSFQGMTAAVLTAAKPKNPVTSAAQGWWITPEDVSKAIAEWGVKSVKSGQAGYSDVAGNPSGGMVMLRKDMPPEVTAVIASYTRSRPHLAMIGLDGTDFFEEQAYPGAVGDPVSRWAGWQVMP